MNTIKILLALAISATAVSCTEDFLTSTPVMAISAEQYYSNDEEMFSALVAAYDPLNYSYVSNLSVVTPYGELISDNACVGAKDQTGQIEMQEIEDFRNTNVNAASEAIWKRTYIGLYRANLVIGAKYTSELAEMYKAEAKFLRAWYHFHLLRVYGPCVLSTTSTYPNNHPFVRSTREEMNAQIEADLLDAIEGCSDDLGEGWCGRVTKSVARAMLAKHYLYAASWKKNLGQSGAEETFDKAIPLLEDVIASGQYQLLPYDKLFNWMNANNKESVFEIQTYSLGAGKSSNFWTTDGAIWVAWCGFQSLNAGHPVYSSNGWGMWFPADNLYQYYLPGDTNRRDQTFITIDEVNGGAEAGEEGYFWKYNECNPLDFEGYEQKKFALRQDMPFSGAARPNAFGNQQIIRLSDVYLMLAECYLRGSNKNEAKAKELMDAVRTAHEPNSAYPTVDDMMTAFPDRFPTVIDALWYERRVELAGEGDRWYDLVRSGRAEEVMVDYLANGRLNPDARINLSWQTKFNYLPIGSIEIASCPSLTMYPDEVNEW